jgi:hypothetical protein
LKKKKIKKSKNILNLEGFCWKGDKEDIW